MNHLSFLIYNNIIFQYIIMINNYYNIPNIPCNQRENINTPVGVESSGDKTLKCSGLNPDTIYSTLYPDNSDPTINYDITSSKKIAIGTSIGGNMEMDANQCARDCTQNNNCTYFTIEKRPNECRLYSAKNASKNNKFDEFTNTNTIRTWRKNDLLEGTKNCNVDDGFIAQSEGYFPDVNNASAYLSKNSQANLTKNECLSSCLYDENCNSVVFMESKSNCAKWQSTRENVSAVLTNPATQTSPGASTYLKKAQMIGNRYGAPNDLADYYKTYVPAGKIGDSFCEFVNDRCMTSYVVGPDNQKDVPTESAESAKIIPAPTLCIPPLCFPKLPDTGLKGKLKVNGDFNIMCPSGDGPDARKCIQEIDKTPFASFDQMGLPTSNDSSNPPNGYLPYTMEYNPYRNLEIPASNEMNEGEKPPLDGMDFSEDCQNWCNKSVDCGGYSYYFGSDGKAKCKYFKNTGMETLRTALKPRKDTTTYIKRGNRYVQKPLLGEIKKPYFNNLSASDTGVPRQRSCIQENFTSAEKYCPYPITGEEQILKEDDNGSNCPTPLIKCERTKYGCCLDNETAKINNAGANCPIIDRNICLRSEFGCCTGTIIPKKYLCNDNRDICKMTNCELNDNETGDPYAFYGGTETKCTSNNSCSLGEMCVDGVCKKYNEKYYNGLNGVKAAPIHSQSGNGMNDLLCGCAAQDRNTNCFEEESDSYEPVCGVDGKTYRTRCIANNSGIKVEHYGVCNNILEKFYNLDNMKMPIKNSNTSYWILSLLLVLLVGAILFYFGRN
jgi:hypothetical protein